jgi:DNA (cytosine-5)-methyltransferase 1
MNELHLFAGAGGGILGGILLGHTPVCAVEIEPYCREVLLQRQRDGILPRFPIWDDVCTFDGRPWRGLVDIVAGGFPCQDISAAGKGEGIDGERSGLWGQMARIIDEIRPRFAFVENSPMLTSRGLGRVLGDLAEMGYNARWGVLGADDAGAPHLRKRIWIVAEMANTKLRGIQVGWGAADFSENMQDTGRVSSDVTSSCGVQANIGVAHTKSNGRIKGKPNSRGCDEGTCERQEQRLGDDGCIGGWWSVEPAVGRVANGVANRVDRLAAIGNGQVSSVAALAWRTLSGIR